MNRTNNPLLLILIAFIAGFLSVLIFHQPMLIMLKAIALAPDKLTAYAMASTTPFGIPRVFSLAFWGGIWGLVLAIAVTWTKGLGYWLSGLIIGALGPSLVNWFGCGSFKVKFYNETMGFLEDTAILSRVRVETYGFFER